MSRARDTAEVAEEIDLKVDYSTPVNEQTGTSYTFQLADARKLTTASSASAVTLTIPPQSEVTWEDNTILRVVNYGAGDVTITGGSGVTVTNNEVAISQYFTGSIIRTGSNAWTLIPYGQKQPFEATGGDEVVTVDGYTYHVFTSSSTFVVSSGKNEVEILLVGGGGGGGRGAGGGGGAGAIEPSSNYTTQTLTSGAYTVNVGAKGTGATTTAMRGGTGGTSQFIGISTLSALGGGGGGTYQGGALEDGGDGGSGGGGAGATGASNPGGSANGSNTNAGGANSGAAPPNYGAGGGGGSYTSAIGGTGTSTNGGNGGDGKLLSAIDSNLTSANFPTTLTGITRFAAGGGGGSLQGTAGTGGSGGGGNGSNSQTVAGSNATGYGSGGGGGGWTTTNGSNGGNGSDGIVIVRYAL